MADKGNVEAMQTVVFLVGVYEGVLPFVSKIFGWHPFLAFPTRLDAPWWWLVSAAVLVVAAGLLEALERAARRGAAGQTSSTVGGDGIE